MDIKQSRKNLRVVNRAHTEALTQWMKLSMQWESLEVDNPERIIIEEEMKAVDAHSRAIAARRDEIRAELAYLETHFQRPDGWTSRWFSRVLAPLPADMKTLSWDDESAASVRRYRVLPLLVLAIVIGIIYAVAAYVPQLMISPYSLVASLVFGGSSSSGGSSTVVEIIFTIIAVLVLVGMLVNRRKTVEFAHDAALREEQWFRSGAENWTLRQRIVSCLSFGTCHIINIIYPVATVCALCFAGAAFMLVYLREYRRSRDTVRATLASAHFHAVYNMYAFWLMAGGVVFWLASSLFS